MKIYGLAELDLTRFNEAVFEKAAPNMPHSHFTHLVPKILVDKKGVKRIYWVNPDDEGVKPSAKYGKHRMRLVAHHADGSRKDHLDEITREHGIEPKNIKSFSRGDKLQLTHPPNGKAHLKGAEVVYRGSSQDKTKDTPRISVSYRDSARDKWFSLTTNVNSVEWRSEGDATSKDIAASGVSKTDSKGETTIEKLPPTKPSESSPQARYEAEKNLIAAGNVYENKAGLRYMITGTTEKMVRLSIIDAPKSAKKTEGFVALSKVRERMAAGELKRVPATYTSKEVESYIDVTDPVTREKIRKKIMLLTTRPQTYALESNALHEAGLIEFNAAGKARWTEEGLEVGQKIFFENYKAIEAAIAGVVARFPLVESADIGSVDYSENLVRALAGYNPFIGGDAGGVVARLTVYAKAFAAARARGINEHRKLRDSARLDAEARDGLDPIDRPASDEHEEIGEIPGGAFLSKPEAMALIEGLEDERDFMSWLYEDPKIQKIMQQWTGIGEVQATLSRKEAAQALEGLAYSPKDGKPYSALTIETDLLNTERKRIIEAVQKESEASPEFRHIMENNLRLRQTVWRKRKTSESGGKGEIATARIEKEIKEKFDGGRKATSSIAAKLIHHGIDLHEAPKYTQLVERMLSGVLTPFEYDQHFTPETAGKVQAALEDIFGVGASKLPERLRVWATAENFKMLKRKAAEEAEKASAKILD